MGRHRFRFNCKRYVLKPFLLHDQEDDPNYIVFNKNGKEK